MSEVGDPEPTRRRRFVRRPVFLMIGLALGIVLLVWETPLHHFQTTSDAGETLDFGSRPARAAAVAVVMAFWWITEATSIYYTALLPLVLFPLLGVFDGPAVSRLEKGVLPYIDPYIFLFLGGMGIAAAMQQWDLHRRVALHILRVLGTRPPRILAGMIVATAAISMWISNTATSAMMLPIGLALIGQVEHQSGGARRELFGGALMLAIAYGANVGGMGTKIGTGPNVVFCNVVSQNLGREITFAEFMALGLPFIVVFLPIVWWVLWRQGSGDAPTDDVGGEIVERELRGLGRMKGAERVVLAVFVTTATLWICSGWIHAALEGVFSSILAPLGVAYKKKHLEAGTAMLAFLGLLSLPVPGQRWPRVRALSFRQTRVIPWPTLVLLGGGFALARGIEASGLSLWMGDRLAQLSELPGLVQFVGICTFTIFFGAIASNIATTSVMMVVLMGITMDNTLALMGAATLAASCDFMLPAGTPPNAIVFGSGYLTIPRMARTGFILNVLAALLVGLWGYFGVGWILGVG